MKAGMNTLSRFKTCWPVCLVAVAAVLLGGCEALYQSYDFNEPMPTGMPVQAAADEIWVTSIPEAADVYVQPYDPEEVPSHDTNRDAYRGKTPLRLNLPPGLYWIELAFDAEVFDLFFDPPYDDVQFEQAGATYEALLFQPLTPGAKRRVLRYYRVDKQAGPRADVDRPLPSTRSVAGTRRGALPAKRTIHTGVRATQRLDAAVGRPTRDAGAVPVPHAPWRQGVLE